MSPSGSAAGSPARKTGRAPRRAAARPPSQLVGYILHQHDWSESSLVLDAFTRELGRIVLVARGAKRPYSQLRPVLMPFQRLQLTIGRTPAPAPGDASEPMPELHTLRQAEWAGTHPQPRGAALFSGFYLHELLRALVPRQDPHPALFDAYAEVIAWLAEADEALHPAALRAFECRLLREVGLLPALDLDTLSDEPVRSEGRYVWTGETGVAERADDLPDAAAVGGGGTVRLGGHRLLALQQALEARSFTPLVLACQEGDADLKPTLRQVLHYHLAGSRLRTRELMRDLQGLAPRPASRAEAVAPRRPAADPLDPLHLPDPPDP